MTPSTGAALKDVMASKRGRDLAARSGIRGRRSGLDFGHLFLPRCPYSTGVQEKIEIFKGGGDEHYYHACQGP